MTSISLQKLSQIGFEGVKYYELLVSRDASPFLYQQAALYLGKKKRYREAFAWIDQAIELSASRIPSIRNSHAVILFRANIESPEPNSPVVADTLKRSMDILAECYVYDQRKNYHAMRFGEQAIQYWDVYRNETAQQYLVTARKWLLEESTRSPWHRGTAELLKAVNNHLEAMKA